MSWMTATTGRPITRPAACRIRAPAAMQPAERIWEMQASRSAGSALVTLTSRILQVFSRIPVCHSGLRDRGEDMNRSETYNALAETLLVHVENNTTDQANGSLTVPTSTYTDPAQWEKEMELIFRRLPLMLALSIEMPNPGDYKAMEAVGRPVLITRGKDGVARAFLNVCSHRGAPLAANGAGHCSRFSCPYHGWTYANDGRLIGVAEPQKFGEFDREGRGLRA